MSLERQPGESLPAFVERVLAHEWFEGATVSELAAFCDCSTTLVARVQDRSVKHRGLRLALEHAELIAAKTGWPFDALGLLHFALERYASESTLLRSRARDSAGDLLDAHRLLESLDARRDGDAARVVIAHHLEPVS